MRNGDKSRKEICLKRHLAVLQSSDAEHLHLKFIEKMEKSQEGMFLLYKTVYRIYGTGLLE